MFNKTTLIILLMVTFFINGCGDSEGENRLKNQQRIDRGEYRSVIADLESKENKSDADYLALGTAYMGDAGMAFPDLISIISESGEDGNGGDSFSSFIASVGTDDDTESIRNLQKASQSYSNVVTPSNCLKNSSSLSDAQRDVCLFSGLTQSMKAGIVINYLGGATALKNAANGGDDTFLKASACALHYAYDGTQNNECSYEVDRRTILFGSGYSYLPLSVVVNQNDTDATASASSSEDDHLPLSVIVNGSSEDKRTINYDYKNSYIPLRVFVNGRGYDYLMTTTGNIRQTIITKGYCYANLTKCTKGTTDCFACPLEVDGEDELTVANLLVDTLNDGLDSILGAVGSNDEITQDIRKYKNEITRHQNRDITLEDIVIYLNNL